MEQSQLDNTFHPSRLTHFSSPESPVLSPAGRSRAWYTCARSWNTWRSALTTYIRGHVSCVIASSPESAQSSS